MVETLDLDRIHQRLLPLINQINQQLQKAYSEKVQIFNKGGMMGSVEVVTKLDIEINQIAQKFLKENFPDIGFISEENVNNKTIKEYNWIVDPLDGTNNFAHKIPLFGPSLGLWKNNKPVYGIISFPMLSETVHAIQSKGTFLNNKKITIYKKPENFKPYCSIADVDSNNDRLKILTKLSKVIEIPLEFNCATYQLVQTALGRIDCTCMINMPVWDIAAGLLMIKEAGFCIEFISQTPDLFESNNKSYKYSFIAGEKNLVQQIAQVLE